jgi:pimeloyl-ACP methyl ester carboxylesterase
MRDQLLLKESKSSSGYFAKSNIPYDRIGSGPKPLVVFQGLMFENKPRIFLGMTKKMYKELLKEYTLYIVLRRPGLPKAYTLRDMSNDYAQMIQDEFGGAVDIIGLSTGGSILLYFVADHPDLVRKAIIHSSAHRLSQEARDLQMAVAHLAQEGRWAKAYALLIGFMQPKGGWKRLIMNPLLWLGSVIISFLHTPSDSSDLVVTVMAEDQHHFEDELHRIQAPVLVVAGSQDPFYTEELFQQTAEGIPGAKIILYPKMGHPAQGKQFQKDILAFLKAPS